jgi:tryptophan synthase beta chain
VQSASKKRNVTNKFSEYKMKPYDLPDARGHFGQYGGTFVAETLIQALDDLKAQYAKYQHDPEFRAEFESELKHFVGRPSPVYHAKRWSDMLGGAQIYFKREDLNHTGAHKINNCIGQALLAKRLGKPRVIAETGAGQHGVATATIAARYGLECVVYMGSEDVKRQAQNVYRMKLLGATVVPVESGSKTLKDALNEALRDWVTNVDNTFYIIGTVAGPHPYPMLVRDFQAIIGQECLTQMPEQAGRQPDAVIACVGGGSNAMGIFYPYIPHENTRLIGVEAAGEGFESGKHSASLSKGVPGVLHGNRTYLLQDEDGQIVETHSVSAGLDYPGVGPEHAYLKDIGRAEYVGITDDEALKTFHECCLIEGIIPALESAHAIAYATKLAPTMSKDKILLVNLSGRGDKDMHTVSMKSGLSFFCHPECETGRNMAAAARSETISIVRK